MGFSDKNQTTGTLVIVRHGESEFNLKNVFAGWVDTPLTPTGEAQVTEAGRAMRQDGFKPDIVYSSTLSRAVNTGKKSLEALGMPNKEILERPALLERHYGGLTGMNKKEAEETFGEKQFKEYRRSYDTPPPPMDATHPFHPENASAGPKVIGMPPNGKGTESLSDVVERVKPFWENELLPQLQQGKNVLIAAHGNSLRALSMIIEGMTPEQVSQYELKNGEPVMLKIQSSPGDKNWTLTDKQILTGKGNLRST